MMARKRAHRLILGVYFVYLQSLFVREFFFWQLCGLSNYTKMLSRLEL